MTVHWANQEQIGSSDVFESLHAGLTVGLISARREDFMTCVASEGLSDVIEKNKEPYDFIPVVEAEFNHEYRIIGLFNAADFLDGSSLNGSVKDHFERLSEDHLIGADSSILDFVKTADEKPCRLVVSGATITGLVSLSDLQKLPVRVALFSIITGFEITMAEAIKVKLGGSENWMGCLSNGRQKKIKDEIEKSRRDDGFVDTLLFTQFCDKADIIKKNFQLARSKTKLRDQLDEINDLRDNLAHANEYAATPDHARNVCAVVRDLLDLREEIARTYASDVANQLNPLRTGVA